MFEGANSNFMECVEQEDHPMTFATIATKTPTTKGPIKVHNLDAQLVSAWPAPSMA